MFTAVFKVVGPYFCFVINQYNKVPISYSHLVKGHYPELYRVYYVAAQKCARGKGLYNVYPSLVARPLLTALERVWSSCMQHFADLCSPTQSARDSLISLLCHNLTSGHLYLHI